MIDISFKNMQNSPLSNLFPHKFEIDGVKCNSMESFIQSLRAEDPTLQEKICSEYSGAMAYRLRLLIGDWRKTGTIHWRSKEIVRDSDEYISLITRAYDCLFEQNIVFKHVLLKNFTDKYFIHSTGCDDKKETLLTEAEYRAQLNRLRKFKQF